MEILICALNLQISNAFSIPFSVGACQISIQHTKLLLTVSYFLLALHFTLKRKALANPLESRESFTWLILLVYKEEQREDRLGPRWTVCNVVSYS